MKKLILPLTITLLIALTLTGCAVKNKDMEINSSVKPSATQKGKEDNDSAKKSDNEAEEKVIENIYISKENNSLLDRKAMANYISKYDKSCKEDFVGKSEEFIMAKLGIPTYELSYTRKGSERDFNNKRYIYLLKGEESSALYLVVKDKKVIDYRIDEFVGMNEDKIISIFQ